MVNNKTVKYEELIQGIEAVIFDMDGTLSDSMMIWEQVDIDFLGKRGMQMPKDLQKNIKGISLYEVAVYFKERFNLTETCEELMQEWTMMVYEMYAHTILPKPGAMKLIERLRTDNIKIAVTTSNSRPLLEAFMNNRGLKDYIEYYCTGDQFKKGKPAPDCYLHTAEMIHTDPSKCLVFEDLSEGIIAGKTAGMKVCGVSDEYSKDERDYKIELSDYYVDSMEELF